MGTGRIGKGEGGGAGKRRWNPKGERRRGSLRIGEGGGSWGMGEGRKGGIGKGRIWKGGGEGE